MKKADVTAPFGITPKDPNDPDHGSWELTKDEAYEVWICDEQSARDVAMSGPGFFHPKSFPFNPFAGKSCIVVRLKEKEGHDD